MTDYFVEGGDVLENKLGIADVAKLREVEETYFSEAVSDIIQDSSSIRDFDFDFLKSLHRDLFGRVYEFAGEIRTVNIAKADNDTPFCYADFIETVATEIFDELKGKEYLCGLDVGDFAQELAKLAANLNALHPFREGNGRTIRLFLQLLTDKAGFLLDYSLVPHDEIIKADKAAFLGDMKPLLNMYRHIVIGLGQ